VSVVPGERSRSGSPRPLVPKLLFGNALSPKLLFVLAAWGRETEFRKTTVPKQEFGNEGTRGKPDLRFAGFWHPLFFGGAAGFGKRGKRPARLALTPRAAAAISPPPDSLAIDHLREGRPK
jgi:hypothetical protein